jgi:hypothetical protein
MSVPCKADTHTGLGSANDSTLLTIRRMRGGYLGAIPQGHRRVPFPLRRHRQIHKVARGYPYGQYHPRCCCCFPQVDCLWIWGSKPYHYGQQDPVQKSALPRVLRGHPHPALLCVCGPSRSNGQTERANAEILRGLKTRTYDCLKKAWCKLGQ